MYNFLTKHGTLAAFLLGIVIIVAFLGSAISGLGSAGYDSGTNLMEMGRDKIQEMNFFNLGLQLTIFLLIAAVAITLVFMVVDVFKFPKQTVKGIIGFVVLVVIFMILKSTAVFETGPKWDKLYNTFSITEGVSSFISAGIWTTLLLMGAATLLVIGAEIRNFFK
jgi:hypothetical protein